MRIVLIGAGSHSFGRGQIVDALGSPELGDLGTTLYLVDERQQALDIMLSFAERVKAHLSSDVRLEGATDRRDALPGADYVITAVARRRMELWEQDFRIPLSYGFRHCLGENGGPGAVFHALRSFNLLMPICADIASLCPDALLLNFTNPEARVLHAILHLTKVRAAGLCHGVFRVYRTISHYLERPADEFEIISAGMNHFYNVLGIRDRVTGEDLRDEVVQKILADDSGYAPPLFKKMVEILGVISYSSDDHIGEYLSYGSEFGGVKWHYGLESRPIMVEGEPPPLKLDVTDYASGKLPLDERALGTSNELAVPIILDMALDRGSWRPAVNVLNTEGYIENLPRDGVVEIPALVDAAGIHPQHVGPLPEAFAAMIRTQFSIIHLVTEAYRTRSRKLLLQALLLDPVVNSITAAEKLLDEMLNLQSDFLPEFD